MRGILFILLLTFITTIAQEIDDRDVCSDQECKTDCNQCNSCRTTSCRQTCSNSCSRPKPIINITEKYEESAPIDVNSASKADPRVNITTDIDIRNYINNTNEIENPIVVNSTNINRIKISDPETPSQVTPNQNCCQQQKCEGEKCPSCPTPSPVQQQPCCNMFNYQQPCNTGCGFSGSPQLNPNYDTAGHLRSSNLQKIQQYPSFLLVRNNQSNATPTIPNQHYIISVPQQPILNQQYQWFDPNQQYPGSFYPGVQTGVGGFNFRK